MPVIGITGGIGSGKSTVASMFAEAGAKVIDADAITRDLLKNNKKCIKKVAKNFPGVILGSGEISRPALSNIVFQHPRELSKLTKILYPEALKEIRSRIAAYSKKRSLIVLDAPLLFEAGWDKMTDLNIVVNAKREEQYARAKQSLGLSRSQTLKRMKMQMPMGLKRNLADIIINNSGTIAATRHQVGAVLQRLAQRQFTE